MSENDWIFEALYELSEASDQAGMTRLAKFLELGMDLFTEEEKRLKNGGPSFRSRRDEVEGEAVGAPLFGPPNSVTALRRFQSDWETGHVMASGTHGFALQRKAG